MTQTDMITLALGILFVDFEFHLTFCSDFLLFVYFVYIPGLFDVIDCLVHLHNVVQHRYLIFACVTCSIVHPSPL